MNPADIRSEYTRDQLSRDALAEDPITQFRAWLNDAIRSGTPEPTAMSLATSNRHGKSRVRTVLLKGVDESGFVFFTNLESRKAQDICENPHVSLLFPWLALERQVMVAGQAVPLSRLEVLNYFITRPRESQLGAWSSQQSAAIASRKMLEIAWESMKRKFAERRVPVPPFWGGYRIQPNSVEFWQGGAHRLHDRFEYTREEGGSWTLHRLSP